MKFIRKLLCKLNIHYHPEKDGVYLAGLSYGRCYSCNKFIYKDEDAIWRLAKEIKQKRK